MAERGEVLAVAWMPQGSELAADAGVGALTMTVANPVDFDEDGGTLDLNGVQLDYDTIDPDSGLLTLTAALTAGAVAGDRANVVSGGVVAIDYVAFVHLGDGDEIEVPIPYAQRDMWPEGDYDAPVVVDLSDDLEVIVDVPGRTPVRDGAFINPSTLPNQSATGDPVAKATATIGYPSVALQLISRAGTLGTFALVPSQVSAMTDTPTAGVVAVAQVVTGGSRVWYYDYTTGANVTSGGVNFTDYPNLRVIGMAATGAAIRMLVQSGSALYVWDAAGLNSYTPVNTAEDPAFACDGGQFLVAENDPAPATTLRVRDVSFNAAGGNPPVIIGATTVLGANTKLGVPIAYVGRGVFDFGANKIVYAPTNATGTVVAPATNGAARDATLAWPNGVGGRLAQCWVPAAGAFFIFPGDGNLYRYTSATVADGLNQWWTGYTWQDTVGTTHETRLGPLAMTTMVNRAQLQVTVPAPPAGTGSVEDVNAYGLYMTKVASGTPATSALHLQSTAGVDTASRTQVVTAVNMSGAAPPTANNFPTLGTDGYLASQAADANGPLILLKGDGSGRIGQASWGTAGVWTGPSYAGQVVTAAPSAVNTPVSVTVTFPAGRFTATPSIVCSPGGGAPQTVQTSWSAASTTGVTIWGSRSSGTLSAITINYIATQMG